MARIKTETRGPDAGDQRQGMTAPPPPVSVEMVERRNDERHDAQAGNERHDEALYGGELEIEPTERRVYRMSGLGGDLSALVAGALGYEGVMPGWLQPYLDEGTAAEPRIIEMFNDQFDMRPATYLELVKLKELGLIAGYNAALRQVQVALEAGSGAVVRGHTDEVVVINPRSNRPEFSYAVLEVKKLRPTNWKMWAGKNDWTVDPIFEKYAWQVSALHHTTKLPVYFVCGQYDPDTARVLDIDVHMVTENNVPHTLAEVKARVMKAEVHAKKGAVPMCERHDESCPYAAEEFCPGKVEAEVEDVDDTELGRLLALHYAYGVDMSQTDEQKEAKKLRDGVKEEIDKLLAGKGYGRGKKMRVWSPTGDEFEFQWVQRPVDAKAYTMSFPEVKLINAGEFVQEDAG